MVSALLSRTKSILICFFQKVNAFSVSVNLVPSSLTSLECLLTVFKRKENFMNTLFKTANEAENFDETEEIKASSTMNQEDVNSVVGSNNNDNGDDTPPTPPTSALGSNTTEDTSLSEESINAEIKKYGLEKLVYSILPPKKYMLAKVKSVEVSIEKLKYDQILHETFKNIPTRQGSHKLLGKQKFIEQLYGLSRHHKEQIEKADFSYMDKAIKFARENNCPTDVNKMMKIKKDEELAKKAEEKRKTKEAKEAELEKLLETSKVASADEDFDATLVDLTLAPKGWRETLPLTDNALLLVVVEADEMLEGIEFIKSQEAFYKTNIIWDRDRLSISGDWCKNKHTMVLIAVKGNPEKPHETFKAESIYFEHQASATHYVPDNFYDLVEKMVPGEKQYLEVFSTRKYSDRWHIMDTKPNNLTKGENKND